jgi:small subunit ribosomal protein S9
MTMPETIKKPVVKKAAASASAPRAHKAVAKSEHRYVESIGRRKTAIARVRISAGDGKITVNDLSGKEYFMLPRLLAAAIAPLTTLKVLEKWDVSARVSGGGIHAQADAVRLGVARALVKDDPEWKVRLRAFGFMTRDSRMVERKKYGLKKARRSPQWTKR